MTTKKSRRRGVVLSLTGQQKLETARRQVEKAAHHGDRLTLEELSERTQLAISTITRVLEARIGVDKLTIDQFLQPSICCWNGKIITVQIRSNQRKVILNHCRSNLLKLSQVGVISIGVKRFSDERLRQRCFGLLWSSVSS
jgi:hypothetical protein